MCQVPWLSRTLLPFQVVVPKSEVWLCKTWGADKPWEQFSCADDKAAWMPRKLCTALLLGCCLLPTPLTLFLVLAVSCHHSAAFITGADHETTLHLAADSLGHSSQGSWLMGSHISHSRDMDMASSSHDIIAKLIVTLPGGNPGAVSLGFWVVGACHHQDLAMGPWGDLEAVINSWNSWILLLNLQAKETGCWSHGWAIHGTVKFYNLEGSFKLIREIFLPSPGVLLITIQGLRTILS